MKIIITEDQYKLILNENNDRVYKIKNQVVETIKDLLSDNPDFVDLKVEIKLINSSGWSYFEEPKPSYHYIVYVKDIRVPSKEEREIHSEISDAHKMFFPQDENKNVTCYFKTTFIVV